MAMRERGRAVVQTRVVKGHAGTCGRKGACMTDRTEGEERERTEDHPCHWLGARKCIGPGVLSLAPEYRGPIYSQVQLNWA